MRPYDVLFEQALTRVDPERIHHAAFGAIRAARPLTTRAVRVPSTPVHALGLTVPHPLGLAAGFDKNAVGIDGLAALGFGHVEVGTVTGEAQPGNPRPRLFRLKDDRAIVNRMGFNNDGATAVAPRLKAARAALQRRHPDVRPVIGVNIGKTKAVELADAVGDYLVSARSLAPAADYLVVNVSSPNTPGLRLLQDVESLRPLLAAVGEEADRAAGRHVPLLVKIAPDLSDEDIDDVARLALDLKLDGIIATNTTIARDGLASPAEQVEKCGAGGLSGAPLKQRSLDVLRRLKDVTGDALTLVAVGGVETAQDVQDRLDAGATLVQGYTAFLYEGPFWAARINRELAKKRRP